MKRFLTIAQGIHNRRYFGSRPMPVVEQHNRSNLLMYGLVTEADVDTLFQLYVSYPTFLGSKLNLLLDTTRSSM